MLSHPFNIESLAITYIAGDPSLPAFVFLHGNSQNSSCGTGILKFFGQRGHTLLSYDLPGHGDSKLDTEVYTFNDLIELNSDILRQYKITKPILCGHSLGGMIQAGTIAQYKVEVSSLILCGSYDGNPIDASKRDLEEELALQLEESLNSYLQDGYKLFKRQFKYDYFDNREIDDGIIEIFNRRYSLPSASENNINSLTGFNVRSELTKLNLPILVLHGEDEEVIPKVLIENMAKTYDDMKLCWFPMRGHLAFYQETALTEIYLEKYYDFLLNPE
jgi:pimeloyl-ACP methyl ester carboxylesterase